MIGHLFGENLIVEKEFAGVICEAAAVVVIEWTNPDFKLGLKRAGFRNLRDGLVSPSHGNGFKVGRWTALGGFEKRPTPFTAFVGAKRYYIITEVSLGDLDAKVNVAINGMARCRSVAFGARGEFGRRWLDRGRYATNRKRHACATSVSLARGEPPDAFPARALSLATLAGSRAAADAPPRAQMQAFHCRAASRSFAAGSCASELDAAQPRMTARSRGRDRAAPRQKVLRPPNGSRRSQDYRFIFRIQS